jgi:lipoyl(octanoyl) transferase
MQHFTDQRDAATPDEIWLLEHPPVFTLGLNAKREHVLAPGNIPVIQIDRGGQVTYHGPGQLVVYPLIDLKRLGLGVRQLVTALENAVVSYAAAVGVTARASREAPGVYVDGAKLASVGLRVRRGSSYHGVALNVTLDLEPFRRINVCGYPGLGVTRLADLVPGCDMDSASRGLLPHLLEQLGFAAAPVTPAGPAPGRSHAAVSDAITATAAAAAAAVSAAADAARYSAISTALQAVSSR